MRSRQNATIPNCEEKPGVAGMRPEDEPKSVDAGQRESRADVA